MKRPGFERIRRRTHIRLSLEHLEHRRLMAGLNVHVFTDQDGSRSISPSVDTPAPNRLVYVDLNRDFQYDDGEPLAASGDDGIARFPGLAAGDYLIGLAANNAAQVLTTSIAPDRSARLVSSAFSSPLTTLIASADLKHGWSATGTGVLTPVGSEDAGRAVLNLNGRLLGATTGSTGGAEAWALVDHGQAQPTLYRLDFQTGSARMTTVQGVPLNQRVSGVVQAGASVYLQLTTGDTNYLAEMRTGQNAITLGQPIEIPSGTLVGSTVDDRLAVLGNRSQLSGEDQQAGAKVSLVQIRGSSTSIESLDIDSSISNLSFSHDGQLLFASLKSGGINVYSTSGGMRSAAQLAEATGPVSGGKDGRFVTGNALKADELIVWNSRTWTPTGRVQLPAGRQSVVSLAVDSFGDRSIIVTGDAVLSARLANPAPQAVEVAGRGVTEASLGVRLIDRPVPLPSRIEVSQVTDEDVPLSFDLASTDEMLALGSGLFFAPGAGTALGTLLVTASGRVTYQTQANAHGTDSATLRVFDGISTTTLVISLDVRPVNDAPTAFVVEPVEVDESAVPGAVAGIATVFDVDSDARYEITTNDSRFIVVDGQVMLSQSDALDYETESAIELEITATDLDNPAFVITRRISIPVRDTNDAPTGVSLSSSSVIENEEGAAIGEAVVSDPDGHGQYSYTVSDERFEFASGQLRLRAGVVLDHETEPVISMTITAIDSTVVGRSNSVTSPVTIQVLDGNDAPTSLSVSASELRSGEAGAVVGRVQVTDQDVADEYEFGVSDSRFVVDGSVLKLRDGQSISSDQESVVTMMVTVTDRGGSVLAETVTLNVVNDAPFQNPRDPFDVDNDGHVYPRDALILVNELNRNGSHILTPVIATGEGGTSEIFFPDVNGDGMLTPLDALILINHINRRATPAVNNNGNGNGNGDKTNDQGELDADPDLTVDNPADGLAEGEGPGDTWAACQPWMASSDIQEQARRDAIDSELELLVDELSRARLG